MCLERQSFFSPSPSLSSCEYTEAFLLIPVCPACLFASPGNIPRPRMPSCPSVDYEHPFCDHRPASHGALRPYRRRSDCSSRRECQTSCRLLQSFRICRGPRQKEYRQKPRIANSIVFDSRQSSLSRPRIQPAVQMSLVDSAQDVGVKISLRRLASSHDGPIRRHRPMTNRCIWAQNLASEYCDKSSPFYPLRRPFDSRPFDMALI